MSISEFLAPTFSKLILTALLSYLLVPVILFGIGVNGLTGIGIYHLELFCDTPPYICPDTWASLANVGAIENNSAYVFGYHYENLIIGFLLIYLVICIFFSLSKTYFYSKPS